MTESERGNYVAKSVWVWLQRQRSIEYVPWVIDPRSTTFDPVKAEVQKMRTELLDELEAEILKASLSA